MTRRRDHAAEQRRRNELARARGFWSRAEERRSPRRIRNKGDLGSLPPEAAEQRRRSLQAVSLMREDPELTLRDAAAQVGTTPEAVTWHANEAFQRNGNNWSTAPGDRLYRAMYVYSNGEKVGVDVRGSRKASELARYHVAVRRYLETGDDIPLLQFHGKSVAGVPYETDTSVLEEMARRSYLDIESIYQLVR